MVIDPGEESCPQSVLGRLNPFFLLRFLYDWVLSWAETRYGVPVLFLIAFTEASFFPIPPDVLLIALALAVPARAFFYAAVCLAGSVLGGILGYIIGLEFMELIGWPLINFYGMENKFTYIQELYRRYDAGAVILSCFTPLPYKFFAIAGGACRIDFCVFLFSTALGRSLRFFLVG